MFTVCSEIGRKLLPRQYAWELKLPLVSVSSDQKREFCSEIYKLFKTFEGGETK